MLDQSLHTVCRAFEVSLESKLEDDRVQNIVLQPVDPLMVLLVIVFGYFHHVAQ